MTNKDKAVSIARSINDRLSSLAKKQKVSFESLLSSFLIERMAARLVANPVLANSLVFKGGFVSLRVYSSPRYTNDLDALMSKGKLATILKSASAAVETDLQDGVWFQFEESVDLATQGEYGGLRLIFRAGIGPRPKKITKARLLNLDIGSGDSVTPGPVKTTLPSLVGGEEIAWSVYPIETICSEKLHTLIARGSENSRAKDVYDLSLFLPQCAMETLSRAIHSTFQSRGEVPPLNISDALEALDTSVLKRGWKGAIAGIADVPDFDACFQRILSHVKGLPQSKR